MNIEKLNISKEEFWEYYKDHNQDDTREYFNISHGSLHELIRHYDLHKTKEQLLETQLKYTPKKEKIVDKLSKEISKEQLFEYYITQNHSLEECKEYFKTNGIIKLLNYYDIHKDAKLSN